MFRENNSAMLHVVYDSNKVHKELMVQCYSEVGTSYVLLAQFQSSCNTSTANMANVETYTTSS